MTLSDHHASGGRPRHAPRRASQGRARGADIGPAGAGDQTAYTRRSGYPSRL